METGRLSAQIAVAQIAPKRPRWRELPEELATGTGVELRELGATLRTIRGQVHNALQIAGLPPTLALEPLRRVLRTAARNGFSVTGAACALLHQAELLGEPQGDLPLAGSVIAATVDVLEEADRPFWLT